MSAKMPRGGGWGRTCGLSAMLFVLAAGLSVAPVIRELQLRLTDTYFHVAPQPASPATAMLVLIDDESLRRYGRWPWSRTLLAQLTRNLEDAGAGVIGLDILLAEPQSPAADSRLRDALDQRTVLVDKIGTYPDGPRWTEPLPEFARSAGAVGHALAVLDRDGVCRRFPPRELTTDGPRWAFAVELARRVDPRRTAQFLSAYDIPFQDDALVATIAKPVLVPISFRRGGFETVSAAAVLQGKDLARVRGRPVLVGFGPAEISDRVITPLSGELPTPGVEVHAHIFDSIISGRTLRDIPMGSSAALLLVTCVIVVLAFSRLRGWPAAGVFLVMGAAVYGGALAVFALWFRIVPAGSMILAVLLGPLLVYTSDLVIVERSHLRQLRELRHWLASRRHNVSLADKADLSWRLELLHDLQTELGSLYELHETLLESTQDLVAIFDDGGHLLLKNSSFAHVFQCEDQPRLALDDVRSRLAPKEDAPLVSTGHTVEGEAFIGDALYFVRIVPLPPTTLSPGGGTVVLLTDLAARVERDRARAEALGFITHELRTPLVSIQGFAEVMMQYPDSPSCAAAPETIFRESKRLLALINSYLDVLRLDAGARPLRSDAVNLDEVVKQVFDILQPLAAAAGSRLVFEGQEPVAISGDAPLLTGAVLNLVSNAIKYGKPGKDILVKCACARDAMVLSVQNQGVPVKEEDVSRLFEPFYRTPEAEANKAGWGLGLAFVKRIAEKHGGSVHISITAEGASFEIHLPVRSLALAAKGTT
ncbi:MAG: CHASE2 domain-containing protein [Acidobacteriia bacterium]|nr:CHASE2 domain-containing protein [Terriglobia bacterium]